jgi:HrpA-like RNA helicase
MEIDKDVGNILKLLEDNLVVKVIAPSGSGKSTNLPKLLAKKYKTTVVVSDNTFYNTLKYPNVTYFLAKDYKKLNFKEIELLIVDEIDGDSFYNFMAISLWKKSSSSGKLLLTSNSTHYLFPQFPTYTVERYLNPPIDIRYIGEMEEKNIVNLIYKTHNSNVNGDFLVFAWGEKATIRIMEELNKLNMNVEIINARKDGIKNKDIYKKISKRKIIVTPKQLVTLDNIGCVFDTMKEKRVEPTLCGGYRNKLSYISKRTANLRALRSRIPCIVYRMISIENYENLPENTMDKIFRIPLHHLMIDIYLNGFDPFEILFNFPKEEINFVYKIFLNHAILDFSRKITEKGKLLRKMNLGLRLSILVLEKLKVSSLAYPSIVLASLIDSYRQPYILFPLYDKKKNEGYSDYLIDREKHIETYFNRFRSNSDVETLLYIWETYKEEGEDLKTWCFENFINYEYMKEVNETINNLIKIFPEVKEERFIVEDFILEIDDYIKKLYENRIFYLDTERTIFAQYYENTTPYKIDVFSINNIEKERPLQIYALISSSSENLNTISISYVSPKAEKQAFTEEVVLF